MPHGSAFGNEANLILVAGEVELQRPDQRGSVQVLVPMTGSVVQAGDTLITGINGRVQLRFSDGSLISLQPRSEFRIDAYQFDMQRQRGFFSLVRGALRTISGAVGKRDPDDYRMTTPTATIGIRGTEYLLEETTCTPGCYPGRTAGARVAVNVGFVVVFNPAGSIELPAGSATYVPSAARAPVPTTERPTMSAAPPSSKVAGPATSAGNKTLAARTPSPNAAKGPAEKPGTGRNGDAKAGTGRYAESRDGTERDGEAKDGADRDGETKDGTGRRADPKEGSRRRADARDGASRSANADGDGGQNSDGTEGTRRGRGASDRGGRRGEAADRIGRRQDGTDKADKGETETDTSRSARRDARVAGGSDVAHVAEHRGRMRANEGEGVPAGLLDRWNTDEQPREDARGRPPTAGPTTEGGDEGPSTRSGALSPRGQRNAARGEFAGRGAGADSTAARTGERITNAGDAGETATPGSGAAAFRPASEPALAPSPVSAMVATESITNPLPLSTGAISIAVSERGYGDLTAPVGDASGTNVQRDPAGLPVAIVAIGGSPAAGSEPPTADPGTPPGTTPEPEPDPGTDPGGDPGTIPGGGSPLPVPSFVNGDLLSILLQSHQINGDLLPNAAVGLDTDYRLESAGSCPLLDCLSRGTAEVVDSGYNNDVSWGRWVNGTARLSSLAGVSAVDLELGVNNGIHYLVGVPTASMPVSGSAYYTLTGATSPTFSSGAVAPGTFTGEGLVSFGSGLSTRVAVQGNVIFGSGEHYRLSSNGVQDGAGRLVEIGNSQLQMTGRSTFGGTLDVASQGSSDRLDCAGGKCQAALRGGFYGQNAGTMGLAYSVGRVAPAAGGDTINGVAVLNRQ